MITLQVKVKPNARESLLEPPVDGNVWSARLKSPPVDGKANEELIRLVADYFDCPRSKVSIFRGAGSRSKLVRIEQDRK